MHLREGVSQTDLKISKQANDQLLRRPFPNKSGLAQEILVVSDKCF